MAHAIRLGHFLAPGLTAKSMYGFIASYLDRAEPDERTTGNLFESGGGPVSVDGGLRSPKQRAVGLAAAGVIVAGLGVFALAKRPKR
jgi:hypothetical protein